jgi:ribosomal-protein-alanine N-acetyltransferase
MTDRVAMPEAFVIRPMTADDAHAIAAWRYADPYSFYDWHRDPDDLAELLDPSEWGRRYFSADDAHGELAGFFVMIKPADGVAEIGLGLRPALTGRGLGAAFLHTGLRFAAARFGARSFALAVAAFNQRAITVYERAGFREVSRYEHATNGAVHEFVWMTRAELTPT